MHTIDWTGVDGSVEHAEISDGSIDSVVVTPARSYRYRATWSAAWVFDALTIDEETFELRHQPGGWTLNGRRMPDLEHAVDLDLSISPFTNTLPIRRLGLGVGEHAEIVTAYVDFPGLSVIPDPQRYTRVAANTWLYESLDSDFRREITVDDDGFVIDYPGLFTRA